MKREKPDHLAGEAACLHYQVGVLVASSASQCWQTYTQRGFIRRLLAAQRPGWSEDWA